MKQNEVLEIYISGYIAALNSMFWKLPKKYDDQSTMYRTGWNTCLNEIRSHIKKQIKMISKKELLEMADRKINYWHTNKDGAILSEWVEFREWASSLPDDQPDLLPFEWPIKEGYEVITRDGRKVEQLTKFEAKEEEFPLIGVLDDRVESWTIEGFYTASHMDGKSDLFLRRKEKKVWVVEYTDSSKIRVQSNFDAKCEAINWRNNHSPLATLYEATLKPDV